MNVLSFNWNEPMYLHQQPQLKPTTSIVMSLCTNFLYTILYTQHYSLLLCHLWMQSLQMMCWWALNPNGNEFKHHLARAPDFLWLAEDGMKSQSFGSQLWDCVLATQAIMATGMVEEYGDSLKKAHFYIKESQVFPLQ